MHILNGEQIVNIGSQDYNDQVWLTLAKKINADCDKTAGFIITYGTDTLEETETAYFLDLTTDCHKPIVIVGAMKPATALGADGLLNLNNAVIVATDQEAGKRVVLLAMDDKVFSGLNVVKMNTNYVGAFEAVNAGQEGFIYNGKVHYFTVAQPRTDKAIFDIIKQINYLKLELFIIIQTYRHYLLSHLSVMAIKALLVQGRDEHIPTFDFEHKARWRNKA